MQRALQVLNQQALLGINPSDAASAESDGRHGLASNQCASRSNASECLFEIFDFIANVVQTAALLEKSSDSFVFAIRLDQLEERITGFLTPQKGDAHALIRVVDDLLIPISL